MRLATTTIGDLEVSRLGLGGMVLTKAFGDPDRDESIATLHLALDMGMCFVDTADSYADGQNEIFVGQQIAARREDVVLASKFGLVVAHDGSIEVRGDPDYVRRACDASLVRLGVDHLDLYYQHRVDRQVPIDETVGAMAGLVIAGKVRHLGLCEVNPAELRQAHSVHPITAVESEWSLWARQIEAGVLPVARELGVGIVPYSPLGRGFLAGSIRSERALAVDDVRGADPRLRGENLEKNLALLASLEKVAESYGASPAQVTLAWLMAQGPDVVPIPGVERRDLLKQNIEATQLVLAPQDMDHLGRLFAPGVAVGNPDATLLRETVALFQEDP